MAILSSETPALAAPLGSIDWSAELSRHARWLRTVIANRLGEPQAVDEVMQEVALAAVAERAPLNDATKAGPWLYRLAVWQSLMYRRRQGRRRKLLDRFRDYTGAGESQQEHDPFHWVVADERRVMVRQALARLAPRDAEILLLKYSEDWTYGQLAAHLGASHAAIETRLHRARGRLRQQLACLNPEEPTHHDRIAKPEWSVVH